jgi:hypothetical protein
MTDAAAAAVASLILLHASLLIRKNLASVRRWVPRRPSTLSSLPARICVTGPLLCRIQISIARFETRFHQMAIGIMCLSASGS